MASAMVLCAGLGTRLRPLTDELPKPLVPVGDRPLLAHVAGRLRAAGFSKAVVNTHHLPEAFASHLAEIPLDLHLVHEPVIRGTAGGVAGARALLGPGPVLVHNGDIIGAPPIGALLAAAGEGMCLAVAPRPAGQGSVGLAADASVVRLRGEVFGQEVAGGDYVGVAAVGRRCLSELPDQGCLIGDWALPELRRGGRLTAVAASSEWTDAGDLASYVAANLSWLEQHSGPAPASWVDPSARVDPDITVGQSVVGRGARVTGSGRLSQCVVWPGAVARAPLSNAVVTPAGRVVWVPGQSARQRA